MRNVLLLCVASLGWAQEKPLMELSLKQAVDIALAPAGSTRAQLAREAINASRARELQTLAALLPNVDGYVSYSDQTRNLRAFGIDFESPLPGFSIPRLAGPFRVFDARGQISQSVFDLSSLKRYQAGVKASQATRQEKDRAEQVVIENVARAYLSALRAQANVESAQANVNLAEALVKLAQSQKNAGTGTGIEVTRAQVQLANEQQRLAAAQNDFDRSTLGLLREMGANLSANVKLTDTMSYKPTAVESVETSVQQALANRTDLVAQQTREAAARTSYSAAKWQRLPSLGISGDYGTIGSAINSSIPTWSAQATARLPVFDGGRRDAQRAEAASTLRSEQIRTRDLRQQIELELRAAADELRAAEIQVRAAREGLQQSENELAQARRRYEAGVTNSIEVTDAQTRLERARDNNVAALYGHNVARLDLQAALGAVGQMIQ